MDYITHHSRNYEMIHHVESKIPEQFLDYMIKFAISSWNDDLIQYIQNKYDQYDFLEKSDEQIKDKNIVFNIIKNTFNYTNFSFLRSTLILFLQNNPNFVKGNINEIVGLTFFRPKWLHDQTIYKPSKF